MTDEEAAVEKWIRECEEADWFEEMMMKEEERGENPFEKLEEEFDERMCDSHFYESIHYREGDWDDFDF